MSKKTMTGRSDQLTMESIFLENVLCKAGFLITGDTREIDTLSKFIGAQYSNDSGWPIIKSSLTGMPDLAGLTAGDSSNDAAWRMVA